MNRRTTALLMAGALAVVAGATASPAYASGGATYYVSTTGSDSNAGTSAAPFLHVQKCAAIMVAGDTCQIGAGTYRETVVPANSGTAAARITYVAAPGARVTIDGSDTLGGWTAVTGANLTTLQASDPTLAGSPFASAVGAGKVYQSSVTMNPALPGRQVFVDGGMQVEAQWPYPGNNPAEPVLASATSGTTTSLSDPALTQAAGFWVGARLTSHNWFVSETGTVTSSSVGTVTASSLPNCVGLSPNQQNLYSLSNKMALLGHPGEWFYQPSTNKLYLWTMDGASPSTHTVEVKQRNVAIDASARSYISFVNVGVRAATAQTSSTSHHIVFDGMAARYVSEYADLAIDPNKVTGADPCDVLTAGETTSGILLRGTANTLRNSTIDWSAGNGVLVAGTGNTVTNNAITNVDYMGSYAAGINVLGSNHVITHNSVIGSGRSNINIDNKVAGTVSSGHTISYNDLADYGKLVVDVGAIYVCCGVNLAGTTIDHNLLHDAAPLTVSAPAPGVYLDLATYNGTVHNNVAWNGTTYGVVLINPNGAASSGNKIYNNTSGTDSKAVSLFGGTYSTSEITNNVGSVDTAPGVTVSNNLAHTTDPQFVNPGARDYSLKSTSPARGAGVVRAPATDGYTDAAPSLGAYQFGAPKWVGGHRAVRSTVQAEAYTSGSGVSTHAAGTGSVMGSFDGGDWARYNGVDFGTGRDSFVGSIGSEAGYAGQRFQIRIDSLTGPILGTATVTATGGFDSFENQPTPIVTTTGVHDVYLIALGTAPGVANLDSFAFTRLAGQLEAEQADAATGTSTSAGGTGTVVGSFDGGDSLGFLSVDFGQSRTVFTAALGVDPAYAGQTFQVRRDSATGPVLATVTANSTGGWGKYTTQSTAITATSGLHDVFVVGTGGAGIANVDWIAFE